MKLLRLIAVLKEMYDEHDDMDVSISGTRALPDFPVDSVEVREPDNNCKYCFSFTDKILKIE